MSLSIGRELRPAYGFDEVAIVPGSVTVNPELTDVHLSIREFNFDLPILAAALDVFAADGFRGATIDRIAEAAGMSKPNLLYYYRGKDEIYRVVLDRLLDTWLAPLRELHPAGDPMREIPRSIRRNRASARHIPREPRPLAARAMTRATAH